MVVGVTLLAILISALITYPAMILTYGSVQATGIVGAVLPIVVPAIVAPISTHRIVTILRETNRLVLELTATRQQLSAEIERRSIIQAELEALSRHDPLTGVLNRRGFYEAVERYADSGQRAFTVTVIDVDDFKAVNDAHGHAAGDAVLIEVANRLAGLGDDPVVARLGGDEFVVVRRDAVAEQELRDPASRAITVDANGVPIDVTFSMGSALHEHGAIDRTVLRADREMYAAKDARRRVSSPARKHDRTTDGTAGVDEGRHADASGRGQGSGQE